MALSNIALRLDAKNDEIKALIKARDNWMENHDQQVTKNQLGNLENEELKNIVVYLKEELEKSFEFMKAMNDKMEIDRICGEASKKGDSET